jgi:RNA polymerase sigma-70 factor (ECF subfamily)
MAAAQEGDSASYQALLRECIPLVAAVARARGLRGDAVDDAVQDTLLTVHRARATYDPTRPFGAWLAAIAQRRSIDVVRSRSRRSVRETHDAAGYESFPDGAPSAVTLVEHGQDAARLREAVAALPPRQREAVQRLGLAEESLDEAAEATGRSKVALKVNLHRALKALRANLQGR